MTHAARTPAAVLCRWLEQRLADAPAQWFAGQLARLRGGAPERDLYIALGYVTRKLGKADLELTPAELDEAQSVRPGWKPGDWSIDQAARLAYMLADGLDGAAFKTRLEQLFRTADIGELITFYRASRSIPTRSCTSPARGKAPAAACSRFSRQSRIATRTPKSSSTRTPGTTWC